LLNSEEGHGRMFIQEDAGYKVISSSVIMGAIANADSLSIKAYLLSEFVNHFLGYNPVTSLAEHMNEVMNGSAFPNPFSNRTTITFSTSHQEHVIVSIHDLQGHLISTLADGRFLAGTHALTWDGTNQANRTVKPGYYICTIQDGKSVITRKIVFLPLGSE
jgi:hypothetical protein